jgi:hypothetical protein
VNLDDCVALERLAGDRRGFDRNLVVLEHRDVEVVRAGRAHAPERLVVAEDDRPVHRSERADHEAQSPVEGVARRAGVGIGQHLGEGVEGFDWAWGVSGSHGSGYFDPLMWLITRAACGDTGRQPDLPPRWVGGRAQAFPA